MSLSGLEFIGDNSPNSVIAEAKVGRKVITGAADSWYNDGASGGLGFTSQGFGGPE